MAEDTNMESPTEKAMKGKKRCYYFRSCKALKLQNMRGRGPVQLNVKKEEWERVFKQNLHK